ncbi:MAG: molybdopterin-dependent oxidoreductase [Deltaproteobacteria bacterium]|nr:molybdopterin-dependent oxidoreductase [Deltaproteobacteria bacterium]
MKSQNDEHEIWEDKWIPTMCGRCYGLCGIRVRRVNGVAVKIEGEPNSTFGAEGGLCGKGSASLQVLYDPNRLDVPLRRTNPEKGNGVDPKWKEITWDEAFAEIVPRLQKIIEDDPRRLALNFGIPSQPHRLSQAVGILGRTSRFVTGAGLHCGNGAHPVGGLIHGSWSIVPDFRYCNYAIYFGASKGHGSGHSALIAARLVAEAKSRGMKLTVFDPRCSTAAGGAPASEWVPIIPGTDAAVALAMCNIIVNELGIMDEPFLKLKTNAPYLVGPDMKYVREKGPARGVKAVKHSFTGDEKTVTFIGDDDTNKPLVWDAGEGKAKVYDDPTIKDYTLEGDFEVRGIKCRPAFALLREHLKQYTAEAASRVSTVPEKTIYRIAEQFATESRVGSTITIDGHSLPHRPVAAVLFRGGQGHENSYHTCFAVSLLSAVVGAVEVPGGTTSWPARTMGFPGQDGPSNLKWSVFKGLDGFLTNERFGPSSGMSHPAMPPHGEWPIELPEIHHDPMMLDVQPIGMFKYIFGGSDRGEVWSRLGADFKLDMLITMGTNMVFSVGDWESVGKALKDIPFIVSFELFNSELTEGFADIVLPDTCYLEESQWTNGLAQNFNHAWGMDDWCYHISQRVVEPKAQRRSSYDVGLEILDRLGKAWGRDLIAESNARFNRIWPMKEAYRLEPDERPTIERAGDRVVKSMFGPEHGWEWFKEHGFIRWPKRVEEAYWMWLLDLRVPIYMEYLTHMKEEMEKINHETGLNIDLAQYTPLVSWFPCTTHRLDSREYDLYCYSYRDILHSASSTMEQPWLDEASRMNPLTYNIALNADTAVNKGIRDGDRIEIETYRGRKVQGVAKLVQGQHPLTIGIAATAGHWAKGQPIARGKGANFDTLLPMDLEHMDPICGNIETAVRVKVKKA